MATGHYLIVPGADTPPDGSASNLAPGRSTVKSSGSAPGVYVTKLLFDAAQLEWTTWGPFTLDSNFSSAPVLVGRFAMASATTGNVILVARLAAITPGDATDVDAKVFSTANTSAGIAVAGTAGHVTGFSLTLTNADSIAAGDVFWLYFGRDGASGSDTATGDMEFLGARLDYTTP